MKKTSSLFQRNYETDRQVRDEIVPGAEWVAAGEGIATQKLDGTSCLVRAGRLYKRHDAKAGKTPPPGFAAAQEPDPKTGHWPGWVPVGEETADRWHRAAWAAMSPPIADGTYELCGPKIQGNPENLAEHTLLRHGAILLPEVPRTFAALRDWLETHNVEGVVWHHPDGRMVKIKARDFGLQRKSNHHQPK